MSETTDFFVTGGTLRPQDPSYVTRPADEALLRHLQAGEFCYVLTPRQMGKSSLMVRTAQRLRATGTAVVIIDLTSIGAGAGALGADQWYLGLLSRLRSGLRLTTDVEAWWQAHATLGVAQRFMTLLHDVVLAECAAPVVILIDEIDATLNLPFRDDFFAALRALYNERAGNPVYNRLTFGLLGVATPTDLIQDRERTPFNIGRRIELVEFTEQDAAPLQRGLAAHEPAQAASLLQQIFTWTNGHPYLTQKLCQALVAQPKQADTPLSNEAGPNDARVEALVQTLFLSDEGRKDPNLTFVQDRIGSSSPCEQRQLLQLYRRVQRGDRVADDDRSPLQNRLELYGLVGVRQGQVQVRNRIYAQVFNQGWIDAVMPVNRQRRLASLAAVVAVVLTISVVLLLYFRQPTACTVYHDQFTDNPDSSTIRLDALANLLAAQTRCGALALDLFYSLSPEQHKALFLGIADPTAARAQLTSVIAGIYTTLDTTPAHDLALLTIWRTVLQNAGVDADQQLLATIDHWQAGRTYLAQGDNAAAVTAFAKALVPNHPVLYYDYAVVLAATGKYTEALTALDTVVQMSEPTALPVVEQLSPVATPTPAALSERATLSPTIVETPLSPAGMAALFSPLLAWTSPLPTPAMYRPTISALPSYATYARHFDRPEQLRQHAGLALLRNPTLVANLARNQARYVALAALPLLDSLTYDRASAVVAFTLPNELSPVAMPFVYVPAGTFMMGSPDGEGESDEHPQHAVTLDAYWIGQTEVTNAQYRAFIADDGYAQQTYWTVGGWQWRESNNVTQPFYWADEQWNGDGYPVVGVSWYEATAYVKWLAQTTGLTIRLPTEAEWERAARGADGRIYPWGNEWDGNRLNYCDANCDLSWKDSAVNDGYAYTAPVDTYPAGASPYGAFDMAGNVWEWTATQWVANYTDLVYNGDVGDALWALRGGSWRNADYDVRSAYRLGLNPYYRNDNVGFRVVFVPGS